MFSAEGRSHRPDRVNPDEYKIEKPVIYTLLKADEQHPGYLKSIKEAQREYAVIRGLQNYQNLLSGLGWTLDENTLLTILRLMEENICTQNIRVFISNVNTLTKYDLMEYEYIFVPYYNHAQGSWALLFVDVVNGRRYYYLYTFQDHQYFFSEVMNEVHRFTELWNSFAGIPIEEENVSRPDSGVYVIMKAIQLLKMLREKHDDPDAQMPAYYRCELASHMGQLAPVIRASQAPLCSIASCSSGISHERSAPATKHQRK